MAGQSLSEIRALLAAHGLQPQHRFGQNFLIDLNLLRKLPAAADVHPSDVILEVGPGTGSLTEILLETGARVVACEIDRGLAALLRERLSDRPNFTLVEGDALATKHTLHPELLGTLRREQVATGGVWKLVANLPYQIATPLLVELLQLDPPPAVLCATIQKEVGERIAAAAGTSAYGTLSVVAQTLATSERIAVLPPSAFWPAPQVDSLMIKLTPRPRSDTGVTDPAAFARTVQRAFSQRRKMLRRILRDWPVDDVDAVCASAGLDARARPEQLAPADWRRLHAAVL